MIVQKKQTLSYSKIKIQCPKTASQLTLLFKDHSTLFIRAKIFQSSTRWKQFIGFLSAYSYNREQTHILDLQIKYCKYRRSLNISFGYADAQKMLEIPVENARNNSAAQNINKMEVYINNCDLEEEHMTQRIKQLKNSQCCICLLDNCNMLTDCNHHMHASCFQKWHKQKQNCPVCRNNCIAIVVVVENTCRKYNKIRTPVKLYDWLSITNKMIFCW